MKIEQEPKFQPITIVLTTKEEAQALWDMALWNGRTPQSKHTKEMRIALSNWFSNEAKL